VDSVIIGKLGYGQPFVPVVLVLVHEELKELFDFLIDSLSLTVSLGVVGGRGGHFDPRSWLSLCMKLTQIGFLGH